MLKMILEREALRGGRTPVSTMLERGKRKGKDGRVLMLTEMPLENH
jgi:hypothetical protein